MNLFVFTRVIEDMARSLPGIFGRVRTIVLGLRLSFLKIRNSQVGRVLILFRIRLFLIKFFAFIYLVSAWKSISNEVLVALAKTLSNASFVQTHLALELFGLSRTIVDDCICDYIPGVELEVIIHCNNVGRLSDHVVSLCLLSPLVQGHEVLSYRLGSC